MTARTAGAIEHGVARVLTIGTWASIALVLVGVVELLAAGRSPLDSAPAFDLAAIPADLLALRPDGALWLGILGLLATPSVRVLASLVGFARGGERAMVVVAALILLVVGLGVLAGLSVG